VWLMYWLVPIPAICVVPLRVLWDAVLRSAASSAASVILPGGALLLGFCCARLQGDKNPYFHST
jgi:hypothetical protein